MFFPFLSYPKLSHFQLHFRKINPVTALSPTLTSSSSRLDFFLMGGQEKKIDQRTRKEIITAFTVSSHHKYAGIDLMQNCDLPPPSKVFVGPDETIVFPMNRACDAVGKEGEEEQRDGRHYGTYGGENGGGDDRDKIELLKALRASQTRAREAEKKAAVLRKERDGLSVALVEEAMQLFAYRQQVRLLELQVLHLRLLWPEKKLVNCCADTIGSSSMEDGSDGERSNVKFVLALALTLGIGVTTVLACKYFFADVCCTFQKGRLVDYSL
ncbi:uncharacterized protein [Arachis hypogaea]|uniref:uncharacterized protein n=1 Tax=Arachis hypogaea TaxID=3818 RepID=UPI003B211C12|nr:uncharacterized protein DS421_20g688260 [Arachis hypogaea]